MSAESKDPAEIITVTFPYAKEIAGAAISPGPALSVIVDVGVDAQAAQMLNGAAQISGSSVLQSVRNGVNLADYRLRCEASLSDGRKLVRVLQLPVRAR